MDEYNALTEAQTAIRVQLARLGMNQADLARKLDILPGTVSRALSGSPLDERSRTWPAMLEALGLEVIIRPKKESSVRPLTAAGVPYTGDAETDAVLNDFPDILERIGYVKRGETELIPLEEVAQRLGLKLA